MDALEAIGSAVSMRWLKSDPVDDELVDKLIWAATRAANPGNVQPWAFMVLKDDDTRREIVEIITGRLGSMRRLADGPMPDDPTQRRMLQGVSHLVQHMADAPVLILVLGANVYPENAPHEEMMYSAVFGAAQNLMVAARALGLGAAYTTFHLGREAEIKERLGIPDDLRICVTIPVGWPGRRIGPLTRQPIDQVIHRDRW